MEPNVPNFNDFFANDPEMAKVTVVLAVMMACFVLVGLLINIVICWLLYGAQKRVPPEFRRIEPSMVWLLLIPCFKLVWNFIALPKIAQSYKAYFTSIGRDDVGDCGEGMALAYNICSACVLLVMAFFTCLGIPLWIVALVFLIIFITKILGLKGEIPDSDQPVAQEGGYSREE